ncbi:TetR/AcrR family transcriptional regulator, partial [Georgenia sp. 10Sc9-8]|nr:TetR/AcrR family transcriptional regulator [Georgenia halotolerans]
MPRAGLTPDRVAELGCQVADEVGWDSLTLAAVAQRVGVRLPSLYKHVANVEDLRTRVAVRTVTDLRQEVERRCHGLSGRAALGALAHAYRGFARSNPGRYPAVVRAPGEGQAELAGAATALL